MKSRSENITHPTSIQIIRNTRFLIYPALLSLLLATMSTAQVNKTKKLLKSDVSLPEPVSVTKRPDAPLATITVTSTADSIDAAAGNCTAITVASLPGPNGQTSLREAICAANNTAGADTINFAVNGTFLITAAGANEDNGQTGDFDLKESVTINGNGPANTIIDGNAIERIFDFFPAAPSTFALNNLTVKNGDTRSALFKEGGAIYLDNFVTTTITNCQIINNFSGASGAIVNRGTLTISNSTLSGNQTIPSSGSVEGGAIRNSGQLSIDRTTIDNNSVRGEGGGIATTTAAGVTVTITNSTISNNTASVTGGGNGNGGGISTTGNDGPINITNSTISGNRADNNGGGTYFVSASGSGNATLTSVTISNNTADLDNNGSGVGGGIRQGSGTVTLRNTIVAGNLNSLPTVRDDISGTIQATSSFNLVGDGTGSSGLTNGINSNQVGSGVRPINAQLGPLANNGGLTQTHAFGTNSPAYDKGNAFGSAADQRGTARPFDNKFVVPAPGGDNSDIGAYESLAPTAAGVRVSGRVTTGYGTGIRNAFVYLTRADGTVSAARTSSFGYYSFDEVPAGETCVLEVESKRFTFAVPTRVLAVTDTLSGVDFVAVQ